MKIQLRERDKWLIIGVNGRFDAEGAGVVAEALENALSQGRRFLELDLSAVDYLSSAGIRVLLRHHQKIGQLKGSLSLSGIQERVAHILETVGLYDLLRPANPAMDSPEHAPLQRVSLPGWQLEDYALDLSGVLIPRLTGEPCTGIIQDQNTLPCEVIPFPPSTQSIGIGALGNDEAQCRGHFGFYIAAGGVAAYKPIAGNHAADYVVYAEAYVPGLHVVSGLTLNGDFAHLVSFECEEGRAVGFSDLAEQMCRILDKPLTGFVLAGECADRVILACGVTGDTDGSKMGRRLPPQKTGREPFGHIHADLFPYHPLRLGCVKLKDTVSGLFEHQLLDVIHCEAPVDPARSPSTRLLRGVVWFSGIEQAN